MCFWRYTTPLWAATIGRGRWTWETGGTERVKFIGDYSNNFKCLRQLQWSAISWRVEALSWYMVKKAYPNNSRTKLTYHPHHSSHPTPPNSQNTDNLNVVIVVCLRLWEYFVVSLINNFIHKTVDYHSEVDKIVCIFQLDFVTNVRSISTIHGPYSILYCNNMFTFDNKPMCLLFLMFTVLPLQCFPVKQSYCKRYSSHRH